MVLFLLGIALLSTTSITASVTTQDFTVGNHQFARDVYLALASEQDGNFIVSPLSAEIILALAAEGARGTTRLQLINALHLPTQPQAREAISGLNLNVLTKTHRLLSASNMYVAEYFQINQTFISDAEKYYKSGVQSINFADSSNAVKIINDFVAQHTNNKIKDIVRSDMINDSTKLMLVNALYFMGQWKTSFERIAQQTFYKSTGFTEKIDMINSAQHAGYYHSTDLNTTFLEMAYWDTDIKITFVLPDSLEALEKNLDRYLERQPLIHDHIDITLPQFETTTDIDIKKILSNEVTDLFNLNADLSGISEEPLQVSSVVQKAFISINENGTEAVATSMVSVFSKSNFEQPNLTFRANHPFLFYIKDNEVILFIGRFTG